MMPENGHRAHGFSSANFLDSDEILKELGLNGDETFMDAGCGDGHNAIKVLEAASKNTTIKYAKAFSKFIENLRSATRYYDLVKTENKKEKINVYDTSKYSKKAIKYDKKAQALFTIHNGWYDNFISIAEEIQTLLEENYEYIDNEVELAYTANRIDSILDKYRKRQKSKTL